MSDIPRPEGLDWVRLRREAGIPEVHERDPWEKFTSKFKENPFVPVGVGITVAALTLGLINLKKGNVEKQQRYMRLRVIAQLATVAVAIGGIVLTLPEGKKNFFGLQERGEQIKFQNASQEVIEKIKSEKGKGFFD